MPSAASSALQSSHCRSFSFSSRSYAFSFQYDKPLYVSALTGVTLTNFTFTHLNTPALAVLLPAL